MSYRPTKDDYEYDVDISLEENQQNCSDRTAYLYQWAKDNSHSCHAAGAEARAQYLESCNYGNEEDMRYTDEMDAWDWVKGHLEDYAMSDTMDAWVEAGTMYTKSNYGWMLDAVGYDIPGVMSYVKEWCDSLDGNWYDKMDELKTIIAKDHYDMWDETL